MTPQAGAARHSVLALSGGVGGAKLAAGLAAVLPPEDLLVVCNTGDDFEHLGLHVSPDLDSVVYALAGRNDEERGWGRARETWSFLEALGELGGETWFRLGDRDLAMHVERTRLLRAGRSLSEATAGLASALGVGCAVAPMSDDPVRTIVLTRATAESHASELAFQHYFVRDRCAPTVAGFRFDGAERATPSPALAAALRGASQPGGALEAIVICPSNPYLSVDPILALPGVRELLRRRRAPVVAVSPIVGGEALKGPAAKIMRELGVGASAVSVARHYASRGPLDGFLLDRRDVAEREAIERLGVAVATADTVMAAAEDRRRVAHAALALAAAVRDAGQRRAPV
jgi:LPPG:FO 2-phospho-L-lactate transferase